MKPSSDPARTRQLLSTFASALRDGRPVPPAFVAAAAAAGYDEKEAEAHLAARSSEGYPTVALILKGLVSDETVAIIRNGEKQADVIGHLELAASSAEYDS